VRVRREKGRKREGGKEKETKRKRRESRKRARGREGSGREGASVRFRTQQVFLQGSFGSTQQESTYVAAAVASDAALGTSEHVSILASSLPRSIA